MGFETSFLNQFAGMTKQIINLSLWDLKLIIFIFAPLPISIINLSLWDLKLLYGFTSWTKGKIINLSLWDLKRKNRKKHKQTIYNY